MKTLALVAGLLVSAVLIVCDVRVEAGQQAAAIQPTPRHGDGRPDLTGVYQASSRRGREWDAQTPGAAPGQPAQASQAAVNTAQREPIPFRPEALARAQEILNRRSVDDPAAQCVPQSSPRMTPVSLFPIEFVHTPKKLVILYEYFWAFRSIPIGVPHPDDSDPSFLGDSVARWEGDTLVVDVTGQRKETWFDRSGNYHSEALRVVERYTLVSPYHIMYEATIEDPNVYSRPWKISFPLYRRMEKNIQLLEYKCQPFTEELLYGRFRKK
jgi:hypothetical protein